MAGEVVIVLVSLVATAPACFRTHARNTGACFLPCTLLRRDAQSYADAAARLAAAEVTKATTAAAAVEGSA
jgi:hypothetical protein